MILKRERKSPFWVIFFESWIMEGYIEIGQCVDFTTQMIDWNILWFIFCKNFSMVIPFLAQDCAQLLLKWELEFGNNLLSNAVKYMCYMYQCIHICGIYIYILDSYLMQNLVFCKRKQPTYLKHLVCLALSSVICF